MLHETHRPMRLTGRNFRLTPLLPVVAWLLVAGIVAWIAAGWYWRLAAPRSEQAVPSVATDVQSVTRAITSRSLFGQVASIDTTAPVSTSRYRLIGVAANSGTAKGFAILQVDDKVSLAAIEGEEFEPGVKLLRVLPRSVEIERNGLRETLSLADHAASGATPPITQAPSAIQPPPPPPPPPPSTLRPVAPPPEANNPPERESTPD